MNTTDFFRHVLPEHGEYFTFIIQDGKRFAIPSPTIEHLAAVQTAAAKKPRADVYYAVASFKDAADGRKQRNVRAIKCLALDIDCGEGKAYENWKYGTKALVEFVSAVSLPRPLIVKSGRGIHVYWVLTTELSPAERSRLAAALRAACEAHGLCADHQITTDNARVLRAPGTTNQKNGKLVEVFLDAPAVEVESIEKALAPWLQQAAPAQPTKVTAPASALSAALSVTTEFPPAKSEVVERACAVIKWAVNNQADVPEPLWYDMLGVAAHCENPEDTALRWSNQYPGHSDAETLKKLAQWKSRTTGPTTCDKLCITSDGKCKGCPYQGKYSSPVQLGVPVTKPVQTATNTVLPEGAITNVPLPAPFERSGGAIIVKNRDGVETSVLDCDMYAITYGDDELEQHGYVTFAFSTPHDGWKHVQMRGSVLAAGNGKELAKLLADKNIFVRTTQQVELVRLMMRDYIESLKAATRGTTLYGTMGWKRDNTEFVCGTTTYHKNDDGEVVAQKSTLSAATNTASIAEMWGTKGSGEKWVAATKIIDKAGLDAHGFALCVGFSAPLYAFAGLKGATVSLYGPTGGGKSLAQMWLQSIYGNPDKLHLGSKFTQNALFARLGLNNNLPVTVDEFTNMGVDDIGEFLYWVTQGRDKERLTKSAVERTTRTWATPVVVSTNRAITSMLHAGNLASEAQMARVMELHVEPSPIFTQSTEVGRRIHKMFTENYGHAGAEFLRRLVELGPDRIRDIVEQAGDVVRSKFGARFSGEERFWEQTVVLAYIGGALAKKWGLIDFDFNKSIEWAISQLHSHRDTVANATLDPYDVLSRYLTDNTDKQLCVYINSNNQKTCDTSRSYPNGIHIRFDLYRDSPNGRVNNGSMFINRAEFNRWLARHGFDSRRIVSTFDDDGVLVNKAAHIDLARGTQYKQGQTYALQIHLAHGRLRGLLNIDANDTPATPPVLSLIS